MDLAEATVLQPLLSYVPPIPTVSDGFFGSSPPQGRAEVLLGSELLEGLVSWICVLPPPSQPLGSFSDDL